MISPNYSINTLYSNNFTHHLDSNNSRTLAEIFLIIHALEQFTHKSLEYNSDIKSVLLAGLTLQFTPNYP